MKVIILSAGQGKRLLPLTAKIPKCLLEIQGKTLLEWQVGELRKCGIDQITVVTGYGSDNVDALVQQHHDWKNIKTLYNPEYATSDNLVSCWKVRDEMNEDFILLNGDTLFEAGVVRTLLASPETPITVTINHKPGYDVDDMKVSLENTRLVNVSKEIPPGRIDGESIGMILFRGDGALIFREGLKLALNESKSVHRWYLSVIDAIAQKEDVLTCSIGTLRWCEVDYAEDLEEAARVVKKFPEEIIFDTAAPNLEKHKTAAL